MYDSIIYIFYDDIVSMLWFEMKNRFSEIYIFKKWMVSENPI